MSAHIEKMPTEAHQVLAKSDGAAQGADPQVVRTFLEIISAQAQRAFSGVPDPGYLQLLRIHPLDGKAVTTRFQIGDVDGMTKAALADAAAGHNAYIEPRALRPGTRGRGKAEDTVGVFALVVDGDADKGRACSMPGRWMPATSHPFWPCRPRRSAAAKREC
jgi:hypothetical protein